MTKFKPMTKKVTKNIYSVVIASKRATYLSMGTYHSLDEAFDDAKNKFISTVKHQAGDRVILDMWHIMTPSQAAHELFEEDKDDNIEVEKKEKKSLDKIKDIKKQKNEIINDIITNKDFSLFKKTKSLLSKPEIKFIEEKLN